MLTPLHASVSTPLAPISLLSVHSIITEPIGETHPQTLVSAVSTVRALGSEETGRGRYREERNQWGCVTRSRVPSAKSCMGDRSLAMDQRLDKMMSLSPSPATRTKSRAAIDRGAAAAAPSPSALDVQYLRALGLSELTAYAQEHGVSKRQAKMATSRDDVMGLIRAAHSLAVERAGDPEWVANSKPEHRPQRMESSKPSASGAMTPDCVSSDASQLMVPDSAFCVTAASLFVCCFLERPSCVHLNI